MAHYKYLGHDLKRELGESINIRELTEDEERYVRYLKRGKPSRPVGKTSRPVEKPARPHEGPPRPVEKPPSGHAAQSVPLDMTG